MDFKLEKEIRGKSIIEIDFLYIIENKNKNFKRQFFFGVWEHYIREYYITSNLPKMRENGILPLFFKNI